MLFTHLKDFLIKPFFNRMNVNVTRNQFFSDRTQLISTNIAFMQGLYDQFSVQNSNILDKKSFVHKKL